MTDKPTKAVTKVVAKPAKQEISQVDSFIQTAIQTNASPETLERLFALHEKFEAEKAKAAFVQALANFQRDIPVIEKTKKVLDKSGKLRYQYAPLDTIIAAIKVPMSEHGLSFTWTLENGDKQLTATAKITHVKGHSEISSFTIPIDTEGYMTAPQKYASAQTFAKRYALCNALGISTSEEDTDATDVEEESKPISDKSKIVFALKRLGKQGKTKEETVENIRELTQLEPVDENTKEILSRLELLVAEKNEYDSSSQV